MARALLPAHRSRKFNKIAGRQLTGEERQALEQAITTGVSSDEERDERSHYSQYRTTK